MENFPHAMEQLQFQLFCLLIHPSANFIKDIFNKKRNLDFKKLFIRIKDHDFFNKKYLIKNKQLNFGIHNNNKTMFYSLISKIGSEF